MRCGLSHWLLIAAVMLSGCGNNVYKSLSTNKSDHDYIAEAQIYMDEGKYDQAEQSLSKVKNHSKEYLLLHVSATLGKANFSLWKILASVIDSITTASSGSGGVSTVFDLLSDSLFGTGEDRTNLLAAISTAVQNLAAFTPADSNLDDLRCFLTGIMVLPSVNDGAAGIATAVAALETLEANVSGGGTTADQCPGIDEFQTALTTVSRVQADLNYVMEQTSSCPFLSFLSDASGSLNQVQKMLKKVTSAADKGCSSPCDALDPSLQAACEAVQLPCIQAILADDTAVASDGVIASCELVLNCMGGTCF